MRTFLIGLFVGAVAGAAGTWLTLSPPWKGDTALGDPEVTPAIKVAHKRTKHRRRGRHRRRYKLSGKPIVLSPAQRAMVWRGSVHKPAQTADFSNDSGGRSLSSSEINGVLSSQSGRFIGCLKKARGNAELSATIQLKMLVNGQGHPTQVALHAPRYLFEQGFAGCARTAARGMRFAATGKATVVTAPFTID